MTLNGEHVTERDQSEAKLVVSCFTMSGAIIRLGLVLMSVWLLVVGLPRSERIASVQNQAEYQQGVVDAGRGEMPSGSVPCAELDDEIRFAIEMRRSVGLSEARIRGQIRGKYGLLMRKCGYSPLRLVEDR